MSKQYKKRKGGGLWYMTIEKIADLLLDQALKLNATDVHIIPRKDDYHVQLRFNGRLTPYRELTVEIGERLISHFKFMSSMDISEKENLKAAPSIYLFTKRKHLYEFLPYLLHY